MNEFEIYFDELTPEVQESLLTAAHIKSPKDMNWDLLPVAVIELPLDDYDEYDETSEEDDYSEEDGRY